MESSTFGMLLSKLKDPHPTVQRYAVRSIFEALKVQMQMGKKAAQTFPQALSECMLQASQSLPALDEVLSQLCALVLEHQDDQDGAFSTLVLTHLQATLECAPAQAVTSVVRTIGFICRHLLSTHSHALLSFETHELHPFVKAFRSRRESLSEVSQQVLALLTQDSGVKHVEVLVFLQPFLNYVLLQPLALKEYVVATRDLYLSLASLMCLNFVVGASLARLLIHYAHHLMSQTTEEADWKFVALRELVDAFENLVAQASIDAEVEKCKLIVADIQTLLVDTCYDAKKHGLSFQPFLEVLGRVVKLQKSLETTLFWRCKILNLAHLLAMTDIKEEQILLIDLAREVLRKESREGVDMLIDVTHAFPFALLWIYPAVNVMATSCTILKERASGLLQDLEDILALSWSQTIKSTDFQSHYGSTTIASYGQLADNTQTLFLHLWFDIGPWKTWKLVESVGDWLNLKNHDVEAWMSRLSSCGKEDLSGDSKISGSFVTEAFKNSEFISMECMLFSALLIHPYWHHAATKAIAEIGKFDPVSGFSFVPVILFYVRAWKRQSKGGENEDLFRLLKVLPTLGVHPMSSSVVAGTLQTLLHSDGVLQGTAIRLLCKTWETADKVYPHLQVELDLSHFSGPITNFETLLSRAASLEDVCKRDADRGVELILSIQACIESGSAIIKTLGLQSLSWLCHHDVIDFYTAWEVLSASFSELSANPMLAESLCCFLQNGALDAAAYPDTACTVVQLLWKAATFLENHQSDCKWWTAQERALNALASFEVEDLIRCSGEFTGSHIEILLSERRIEVLRACEKLVVKFLCHEFKFRRRGQENVKHADNKLGKLFTAIPQALSVSVQRDSSLLQSPAALMLINCQKRQPSEGLQNNAKNISKGWEIDFEQQFTEIADSADLQGNLICALLYLDVWHSFLNEQLKEKEKNAMQLMKVLFKVSREAIPRVAENAVLALAILYQITESLTAEAVTINGLHESIVSYLKSCIAQHNHEYLQWTSAAALGYVAQHCNTADWRFKAEVSTCLLECLSRSDRDIVRGACSMGLGFLFINLFAQDDIAHNGVHRERTIQQKELIIHELIFQHVLSLLLTWCPQMRELLQNLNRHHAKSVKSSSEISLSLPVIMPFQKLEEGTWTIAGIAMALGCSAVAFEKIGYLESLSHVTELLIQAINVYHASPGNKECFLSFAVGAYISLPQCIGACVRLELLTKEQVRSIPNVKDFLTSGKDKYCSPELKMAACIGSGNLLATLLNHGTPRIQLDNVLSLIESLKAIAVNDSAYLSSLGGYIGLANAFGAGAALLAPQREYRIHELKSMPEMDAGMESSGVCTPVLYASSCKEYVRNLLQELLNLALQGSNHTRSNAWWALALVRRAFLKGGDAGGVDYSSHDTKSSKFTLTSLSKDSSTFLLCSWLMNVKNNQGGLSFPYQNIASALRCLRRASQLPYLDWGTLLRQMLHEVASLKQLVATKDQVVMQDEVCRECVLLALAHARSLSGLQSFLDELSDFPRLISIGPSVTSLLMSRMAELSSIFSRSRLEKFFFDCVEVVCKASKFQGSESLGFLDDCLHLRISFWKGLKSLLLQSKDGLIPSIDKNKLLLGAEKCLGLLETPLRESETVRQEIKEWSEALECMVLASDEWIAKMTEVNGDGSITTVQVVAASEKAVFLKAQMVARHRLEPSALVKPVRWLRNQAAPEAFQQLLWVVSALREVTVEEKQSWLMDSLEAAFSLKNPETGVVFLALLASSWCCYSPLILIDIRTTMQLLPFTLSSLLSEQSWRSTSKLVLQRCVAMLSDVADSTLMACSSPLWYVKRACSILRRELPFADQLRLVDDLTTSSMS